MRAAATTEFGFSDKLTRAKSDFPSPLPFHLRVTGWSLAILCTLAFILGPLMLMLPLPLYFVSPRAAATLLCIDIALVFQPVGPWSEFRESFQLFYEIFDLHHNLTPSTLKILKDMNHLSVIAMHPHGIIPLHSFIWSAFCQQKLPELYGVGATTNIALFLPILRHILGHLSVVSAKKETILHEMNRKNKSLFILPGGVAEIFLSNRRSKTSNGEVQSIKARRHGLMKLALQTGAVIYPVYIFGATDLFNQLMPVTKVTETKKGRMNPLSSLLVSFGEMVESISRRLQGGISIFWGQYFLPIPHNPRLSMVIGDPVYSVPGTSKLHTSGGKTLRICETIKDPTNEEVEELVNRYTDSIHRLFEQYKMEAGYPNDTLKIF